MATFVDLVRDLAATRGSHSAYSFLNYRPEQTTQSLTYQALDIEARRVAAHLRERVAPGERAVLLFRPGLEFVSGFFGCLYAGVVAVPAVVPRLGRGADRVGHILRDAQARVLLTTTSVQRGIAEQLDLTDTSATWLCTDDLTDARLDDGSIHVRAQDLALLQYSSGSTGAPKGVMISHANLMHQSGVLRAVSQPNAHSCQVSWLPQFHDFGLVAGVLQPLYAGYQAVLMAPEAFVEQPLRWLQAMADYHADIAAAPNFAFELCVKSTTPEQRRALDLSAWRLTWVGAEVVRPRMLREFQETFADAGFRANVFCPGLGMAEATLTITLTPPQRGPLERWFKGEAIERGVIIPAEPSEAGARGLISNGPSVADTEVRIVAPDSRRALGEDAVGEIWTRGPGIGLGYFGNDEATRATFGAHIANTGEGPFLRTGDLGFFHGGELYVCGRLKDLMVVRGRNYHATDLEATVQALDPLFRSSHGAAFSVDVDDEERVVVVQELERGTDLSEPGKAEALLAQVQKALAAEHELQAFAILLLRHGTLPKTSSGKVQRSECRARFLADKLHVRAAFRAKGAATSAPVQDAKPTRVRELEQRLIAKLAEACKVAPGSIDVRAPLADLKLAHEDALRLSRELGSELRRPLPTSLFMDAPTIEELARVLGVATQPARKTKANGAAPEARSSRDDEPIAIVGIGCRFPGAQGPRAFWQLLCSGTDAVSEVPPERWDVDEVYDPNPLAKGKVASRCGGFLRDIDQIDRKFFGLSVREAERMDPQHRLMLEVAWEALEDAGVDAQGLAGTQTGVFVGISGSDYAQLQFSDANLTDAYAGLGCALTIAASRISHALNLLGPAIAVDTACSSSLTAVHLACGSLRAGECEVALAGGVNVLLSPITAMCLTKAGMLSPDGRCKAFDASANGYVRSEGAGIVVLKPLARALADKDPIYAVIRGTASNQDGRSSGLAAPNGDAQRAVIRAACSDAGIVPGDLDYVEAHGTGTALGDPIEVNALGAVLGEGRAEGARCAIGSVKTNIGHAESAAGVASLIKTALVLRHRTVPPSLHFQKPNPLIPFETLPLRVQTELGALERTDRPALAGVNGFGVGGTNVHVVLEEYRASATSERPGSHPWLVPLSASSAPSLRMLAASLSAALRDMNGQEARDALFTLARRRAALEHRMVATADSPHELARALDEFAEGRVGAGLVSAFTPAGDDVARGSLAFVFSGQGSQWIGMGRELFEREPEFRAALTECDRLVQECAGYSLLHELRAEPEQSRLDMTLVAQPAIFAIQVSLAALWKSWGITPDVVLGHSVGEVAAAHVAGALTLTQAVSLITLRARLMQEATGFGKMVSVELAREEVEPLLASVRERVSIAAVNGATSVVLSGESSAMDELVAELTARGAVTMALPVNYAFHSPQMEPYRARLVEGLAGLAPSATNIPMISTVTGKLVAGAELDAHYWGENLRQAVLLLPAVEELARREVGAVLEIGPHPVLSGLVARTLKATGNRANVLASLRRDAAEQQTLLMAFGALWTNGREVDWARHHPEGAVHQALPTYPWDRQRYWLDVPKPEPRKKDAHPLLARRLAAAEPTWEVDLEDAQFGYAAELSFRDGAVLPRGIALEAALSLGRELCAPRSFDLTDLHFFHVQGSEGTRPVRLQLGTASAPDGGLMLSVFVSFDALGTSQQTWRRVLSAHLTVRASAPEARQFELEEIKGRCTVPHTGADFYRSLEDTGAKYGSSLRLAAGAQRGEQETLVALEDAQQIPSAGKYVIHPAVVETLLQAVRADRGAMALGADLAAAQRYRVFEQGKAPAFVYLRERSALARTDRGPRVDAWLLDASGTVLASLEGAQFQTLEDGKRAGLDADRSSWVYENAWRPVVVPAAQRRTGQAAFVILSDRSGLGRELAECLRAHGERCITIEHGTRTAHLSADHFVVPQSDGAALQHAISQALATARQCRALINLWALDAHELTGADLVQVARDHELTSLAALHVIQAVSRAGLRRPPRVYFATRAAQPVHAQDTAVNPLQASLWGLNRVLMLEHPELQPTCVDLPGQAEPADAARLAAEVLANGRETQVAFRMGTRLVARLVNSPPTRTTETVRPRAPRPGEVEVRVSAAWPVAKAGLKACSGQVRSEGSARDVVLLTTESAAARLTCTSELVCPAPRGLSASDAARTVLGLSSALYALEGIARLTSTETVLIQSADLTIEAALIQVARMQQARVLVAGRDAAHCTRLRELGVDEVFDASALDYVSEIIRATEGRGADVLACCLESHDIPVGAAAPFARIVDVCALTSPALATELRLPHTAHATLARADLARLLDHRPLVLQELVRRVSDALATGRLTALPSSDETGVSFEAEDTEQSGHAVVRGDATYLVTGGLGALGLALAVRLSDRGARHLVLLGRSAPSTAARNVLDALRARGVEVKVAALDIADRNALGGLLAELSTTMPALRGVVHAAGILDNGLLLELDDARFRRVMSSKVDGACNLHELTQTLPLDFFVLYSSLASCIGSPGQGNYAAANAFLDGLAAHRHARGLPGLSIGWGPWADIGMASSVHNEARLAERGMGMLPPSAALDLLEDLLEERRGGAVGALFMNWPLWATYHPAAAERPTFAELLAGAQVGGGSLGRITGAVLQELPEEEQLSLVRDALHRAVGQALHLRPEQVPMDVSLSALGLDSIVALELRGRIDSALDVVVQVPTLLKGPTIDALARQLLPELLGGATTDTDEVELRANGDQDHEANAMLARIDELSDEEVAAMLESMDLGTRTEHTALSEDAPSAEQ